MTPIDTAIVFGYLVMLIGLGIYASRRQQGPEDYFLAGRRQGTLSIACLWLASWVGGAVVVGTTARAYDIGISASWYVLAQAIGLSLFGLFFAARVKRVGDEQRYLTYPEFIADRFDNRTQIVATVTTSLAFVAFAAGQLVAAASIIEVLLGWSYWQSLLLASGIVILYTATGGYLAVTYTDWVQFVLLLLGVVVIGIPVAYMHAGGPAELAAALPESYFDMGAWGWQPVLALIVSMGMSFFVAMDSFTRCFAAKSAGAAQNGALLGVVFVLPIALAAAWLGVASAVLFPGVESSNDILTRFVVELFPVGLKGLVLVGILAAVMSTADICILTASANVTRDVVHRYIDPGMSHRRMLRLGMLASVGAGLAALSLAWGMQDIINVLLLGFTINGAALFLPTMIAMYRGDGDASAAFWSILASLVTVVGWKIASELNVAGAMDIEPLWPGLAVSFLVYTGVAMVRR
jgi:SSS family solute:Na+ symporter